MNHYYCTPENNVTLYVNYLRIKIFLKGTCPNGEPPQKNNSKNFRAKLGKQRNFWKTYFYPFYHSLILSRAVNIWGYFFSCFSFFFNEKCHHLKMISLVYKNVNILDLILCFFSIRQKPDNKQSRIYWRYKQNTFLTILTCWHEHSAFIMTLIISKPGLFKQNFFLVHDAFREKVNSQTWIELDLSSSLLENVASEGREFWVQIPDLSYPKPVLFKMFPATGT